MQGFDFRGANKSQREAITTLKGPLLLVAGPGTGKTFVLIKRAAWLMLEQGIKPESILMTTFTNKAADEIKTRIALELENKTDKEGKPVHVNPDEMVIGTFHSICLNLLKEHGSAIGLEKGFHIMEPFELEFHILNRLDEFLFAQNPQDGLHQSEELDLETKKKLAGKIAQLMGFLSEEIAISANPDFSLEDLAEDEDEDIAVLPFWYALYEKILDEHEALDFSGMQTRTLALLQHDEALRKSLQDRFSCLMVDEFQDTNRIQQEILFLLAGDPEKICVVGDDDQGLYRFRGATIENILNFGNRLENVKKVILDTNYRSDQSIIRFFNEWMHEIDGTGRATIPPHKTWHVISPMGERISYRHPKMIRPGRQIHAAGPAVLRFDERGEDLNISLLEFLNEFRESGHDLSQVAFLFHTVKNAKVKALAAFLEKNDIPVYTPRSDQFFERFEVRLIIGFLLAMFPDVAVPIMNACETMDIENPADPYRSYLGECLAFFIWASEDFQMDFNGFSLPVKPSLSALFYDVMAFEPFKSFLEDGMEEVYGQKLAARNLAAFSRLIEDFENLQHIQTLDKESLEYFFGWYLHLLWQNGLREYEEEDIVVPKGCVSFLTIFQSKGMEFPVVIVDPLDKRLSYSGSKRINTIISKYLGRELFEKDADTRVFDLYRLYYVAFSRAQDLLILTYNGRFKNPNKNFKSAFDRAFPVQLPFDMERFDFQPLKEKKNLNSYSYSQISLYGLCPWLYRQNKKLDFSTLQKEESYPGIIIHQVLDSLHQDQIHFIKENPDADESERQAYTDALLEPESIKKRLEKAVARFEKHHPVTIDPALCEQMLRQINAYADWRQKSLPDEMASEVSLSAIVTDGTEPLFVLKGTADLLEKEEDGWIISDFKTGKVPDMFSPVGAEQLEAYKSQLNLYAWLLEKKDPQMKIKKMRILFLQDNGVIEQVFERHPKRMEWDLEQFSQSVRNIEENRFERPDDARTCHTCQWKTNCHGLESMQEERQPQWNGTEQL